MRSLINKLASLKLTLTLFLLLGLMSAFGTFLPQGSDMGKWEELVGATGARVATSIGLVDFYHSLWFQLLLVGLSLNMVACMWSRFPGMVGAVRGQAALGRKPILQFPDDESSSNRLFDALAGVGFREGRTDRGRLFNRRAISYLFILITHASLLMIMSASFIGSTAGFIFTQRIYVGDTADTAFNWKIMSEVPLPFQVRSNDLVIVPNPVGVRLGVLDVGTGEKGELITTHEGDSFTVPGLPGQVTLDSFDTEAKQFSARWTGAPGSTFGGSEEIGRSGLALVPVAFATWPERQVLAPTTLLKNGVELLTGEISVNHPLNRDGVRIYLTDYGKDQFGLPYVGFQFVNDPGEMGVWIGCILFLIGAPGAVFTRHSCVVVTREDDRIQVYLSSREDREKISGLIEDVFRAEVARVDGQ
jgi:cytochrome c biogenesis protein ResB